jgi:hypothetical protein
MLMRIAHRRTLCTVFLSFAAGLSPSTAALAATGPVAVGPAFQIDGTQQTGIDYAKVAKADDGSFVIAGIQPTGSSDMTSNLVVRRFAADGTPLTPQILVSSSVSYWSPTFVQLVTDAQGNFLVGWTTSWYQYPAAFLVQLFDANGNARGAASCAFSDCRAGNGLAVAMNAAGGYVTATSVRTDNGSTITSAVVAQRFAASGAPLDANPFAVNSITSPGGYDSESVTVGMSRKTGDFAVGWTQLKESLPYPWNGTVATSVRNTNFVQRYQANGTPAGTRIQIGASAWSASGCGLSGHCWESGFDTYFASLFMQDSGAWLARWSRGSTWGNRIYYSQRYDASGFPTGTKQTMPTYGRPVPVMAANGDGSLVSINVTGSSGQEGLRGQAYDASGAPLGWQFDIVPATTSNANMYSPAISMDAAGNFIVVWSQSDTVGLMGRLYTAP